jgi:Tol biopolymer transport system component
MLLEVRIWRSIGIAAALLLAACGGGAALQPGGQPSTQGPPAEASGTFLILRGDNLFTYDPATKQQVQLTHETNSNFANNPVFSPDGTLIAYTHHIAPQGQEWGGAELHVMKADGSGDRTLVPAKAKGERAESPVWTPDGQSIYYAHDVPNIDASNRYTGDALSIDSVPLAGGEPKTVVKDAVSPSISRGGAFVWVNYNVADSSFKLMAGALEGSGAKQLLSDKDFQAVYGPALSPDGKTIVFAGSGRTNSKVAAVIAAALNPLLPGSAEAHGLPWDPWIIRVDGTGLKKLANIGSDEMAITWSPDGSEIAFANLSSTYVMRADGGGLNRLLQSGDPGGLDWRPAAA